MTWYELLILIGFPSLFVSFLVGVRKFVVAIRAVKLGVQAMLRSQMIDDYNKYSERGYAPIYARDNFENCYQRYHALGANGVMDDIHDKFMKLPTKPSPIERKLANERV